jgi:acyl dehydratase
VGIWVGGDRATYDRFEDMLRALGDRPIHVGEIGSRPSEKENEVQGLYFDEFETGQVFRHTMRRTITEADNTWFSLATCNPAAIHLDEDYCRNHTEFGTRIVNSAFTLGLMIGLSVGDTTMGTTVGNLGMDEVRFPKPVFHGDTIRAETEILDKRESKSRPDQGIVTFQHRAFNQRDELVAQCKRMALMLKKPAA